MNSRNADESRNIGLKDIDQIGVSKANKETWGEVADNISSADNAPPRTKNDNGDN
jgi:hypothetical protein